MSSKTLALFALLFISVIGHLSSRGDRHKRNYVRPLSGISPSDIRRGGKVVGNMISGFYTKVAPKEKWPNAVVPWEYDAANTFTTEQKAIIKEAMDLIEKEVCIEFVPKGSETGYISIKNSEEGCWAELGYLNKKQEINMDPDCFEDSTTAIHEIMHALGFEHEQTRYDRDMYVEIQWSNIETGKESNFEKLPRTYAYPKFDFDFMSLMMYTLDSFGRSGRPSMIVVRNPDKVDENQIGRAKNMTETDIWRMYSAYSCEKEYVEYPETDYGETPTSFSKNQLNFF